MNFSPFETTPTPSPILPDLTMETLPEALRSAVLQAGWQNLMPVQARAIPYLLEGRDMLIQARTGSGKTGAFLLPMLTRLNPVQKTCQALVLAPTRELARQVAEEAERLCSPIGLRSAAVYGGVGYRSQLDALAQGAHIVVGTPGRVLDHLLRRTLSLENLQILVFDEADRMLSMGFYPDIREIRRYLPKRNVHTCLFSATFPYSVHRTARDFIATPEFISLSSDHIHVSETEHLFYVVDGMDKDRSLVRLIEVEQPESAIIFCNTKDRVHYVNVVLQRFGYDSDELSADLSQNARESVLERVRTGQLRFLVATDIAARGLDIPSLSHVIQYEPPEEAELYIHRAGRTGRAGATGIAISLVNMGERFALERIAKQYSIPLEQRPTPTDADVQAVVAERAIVLLEARLRSRDKLQTERSRRFEPLIHTLAENEESLSLLTMLLDDDYQKTLHAPAIPAPEAASPPEKKRKPRPSGSRGRPRR